MRLRKENSQHHTVVFTLVRNPGAPDRRLHVLYLLQPPSSPVPFIPLVDYVIDVGKARALAWQRRVAGAVGLFIDFVLANSAELKDQSYARAYASFAEALVGGTLDLQGCDPSGLFSEPKTISNAKRLLGAVTAFSDWLENRYGTPPLNPMRRATLAEQMAYWRALDRRKPHELLGYATYRSNHQLRAQMIRTVRIERKTPDSFREDVKDFPADHIWDLLTSGFVVRSKQHSPAIHERLSLKDILITILLHGGGLRLSEPFHIFTSDISIDPQNPKSAVVRLYHPEQGAAPADYVDPIYGRPIAGDREEYLRVRWGMKPRTLVEGRFRAGWKELYLFDAREKYALVNWFAPAWGELFLTFLKPYIIHCRARECQHPFLFVSQKTGFRGDPYTPDSYRQAHARAVRRIELMPAKDYGTTPHGHRHAYGSRLAAAGVDELTIQHVLHHRSPASQAVYTAPPAAAVAASLSAAQSRVDNPGIEADPANQIKLDARLRSLIEQASR